METGLQNRVLLRIPPRCEMTADGAILESVCTAGAADDEESWSQGLTASLFWQNAEVWSHSSVITDS